MWNNLDKLGSNRIEPVYYWREVVTVTIKHLKKKKEQNNKITATKINSEKKSSSFELKITANGTFIQG